MDHSTRSSLRGLEANAYFPESDLIKNVSSYCHGGYLNAVNKGKYEPTLDPSVNLLINTQLCARFISKGYCNKRDCTFAHSDKELRPLPDLKCTKWCRLVFHGLVCHDELCPYAHTTQQLRSNAHDLVSYKTSYCKYFLNGNCLSGANCRFAHSPLELRALTNHPRCAQVREQLKTRNRDIQLRRQQLRQEKLALTSGTGEEPSIPQVVLCHALHHPPPGFLPLLSGNDTNGYGKQSEAILMQFSHMEGSTLDSNLSAAYLHARQRAKMEKEQRIQHMVGTLSRISTGECLHATEDVVVSGTVNSGSN